MNLLCARCLRYIISFRTLFLSPVYIEELSLFNYRIRQQKFEQLLIRVLFIESVGLLYKYFLCFVMILHCMNFLTA